MVPTLMEDEEEQKQIWERMKAMWAIGRATTPPSTSETPPQESIPVVEIMTNPTTLEPTQSATTKAPPEPDPPKRSNLFIQPIPPFKRKPSNPPPVDNTPTVMEPIEPPKPNPFFGIPIKKAALVHIKGDFNPFKQVKVAEASAIGMCIIAGFGS